MEKIETNQKFIFVTGPSESGKSGGVNYLKDTYSEYFKHLKIRNIFPEVYKDSNSDMDFQTWYDYEYENNFESLWTRYILKAIEMSEGKSIVIMDTMYGVKTIKYLYSILGDNLGVLYIDADFNQRVIREYHRLRTDSVHGTRKANLSITIDDVIKKTREKDEKKRVKETFEYKNLVYNNNTIDVGNRTLNAPFSYLIENNCTVQDFHEKLDEFAQLQIRLVTSNNKSLKKQKKNS